MSPKAGAHGELCGMMAIKAAIAARGEGKTRNVVLVPEFRARHQSRLGGADRLFRARRARRRRRRRERRGRARGARPRRRRHHAHQSQHLRPVRARHRRHRGGHARSGSVFLLRRREFQRHHGQDPARRSRRRRHAHQFAQDLLDAARRRRPRRGPGGASPIASPPSRRSPMSCSNGEALELVEHERGRRGRSAG